MNQPWLNDEQLEALTRRKQTAAQVKELTRSGIPFRMVADRPVVFLQDLSAVPQSAARPRVKRL